MGRCDGEGLSKEESRGNDPYNDEDCENGDIVAEGAPLMIRSVLYTSTVAC